jgi:DNA polymerase III delta subunit
MITVVHGDDLVSSRNFILKVKTEENATTFYADTQEPHLLLQLTQGKGLFDEKKPLVIENIFSKKAAANLKLLEEKIKVFKNLNIYIWEGKELSKAQLNSLGQSENRLFKIPQKIFSFLDSLLPGSSRNVTSFHEALLTTDEEFMFFMLIRQFRLMLNLEDPSFLTDDTKRLAPWQKSKLTSQAKRFGTENLTENYKKLYKIESKVKVGSLNMPLVAAIDIFLAEI